MHTHPIRPFPRSERRNQGRLLRACSCLGVILAGCAGQAIAVPQAVWVAQGTTEHVTLLQASGTLPTGQLSSLFSINNGPLAGANVYANWAIATQPGSLSGQFAESVYNVDAAIGDQLHPSRRILGGEYGLPPFAVTGNPPYLRSLRIATRGDLTIIDPYLGMMPDEWLIRDAQCSGTHSLSAQWFQPDAAWIGGTGSMVIDSARLQYVGNSSNTTFTKSGPGVLVFDPSPTRYVEGKVFASICQVYDGTMVLRGAGLPYLIGASNFGDVIRIGTRYGGTTLPPTSVPLTPWTVIDLSQPPTPNPRVLVQADNVVPPGKRVRMGAPSTLRFEAPEPISFLGSVVSDDPGPSTRIECAQQLFEAVTFDVSSLTQFLGTFRVERGVARLQGAPNVAAAFSLAAPEFTHEAILELKVPGPQYTFSSDVTGLGRVLKWGPGTLTFASDTTGFTGDFFVEEGMLVLPPTAPADALRNAVSVEGPTSVLSQQADDAVADNTYVLLDDSGRWLLNGRSDTISRLQLVNNARLELAGGTLTLGGGVLQTFHTPGGTTTATVAGPGTLVSAVPLALETSNSQAPIDLDIQARLTGSPVLFTGPATVRLGGSAAGASAITVQDGELRLNRTGVDAATGALTIGNPAHGFPFVPDASVVLEAADQLPDGKTLTMNVRASLNLNGFTDTIGGLAVSGDGPFSIGAGTGELVLAGDASFSGNGTTTISGPLNMLAGSRGFTVNAGSTLLLTGTAYSGTLNKLGTGALRLDALDGYFTLNNSGFSTSVGTASVGGLSGTGSVRIDTALTVNTPTSVSTAFSGAINGAGSFTKSGPGRLELNSNSINNYTGPTRVDGGTLFLNRPAGITVIRGNLTIAGGGTVLYAGGATNQIADTADVTVEAGGVMDLAGQTDTIRNLIVTGTCRTDTAAGALGTITAAQTLFVVGGNLDGGIGGGALNVNLGRARVRGTVSSASLGLAGSTLAVGGFPGSDQLTMTGAFSIPNPNATIECTLGTPSDPALIRALGSLAYPLFGTVNVRVIQNTPAPFGTSFKLIDFGTGTSSPNLAKYAATSVAGSGRGRLALADRTLSYVVARNPCSADADGNGTLSVDDIFFYINLWFTGTVGADYDLSGTLTLDDLFVFINGWFAGC